MVYLDLAIMVLHLIGPSIEREDDRRQDRKSREEEHLECRHTHPSLDDLFRHRRAFNAHIGE